FALPLPPSFLMLPLPPPSTLFPYTTLFRSLLRPLARPAVALAHGRAGRLRPLLRRRPLLALPVRPRRPRRLGVLRAALRLPEDRDRKSTRLNSSHVSISYAVFCLKKKKNKI